MAHWGIAMSVFHQIWDRPDEAAMSLGWREMRGRAGTPARTAREREYIAALGEFLSARQLSDYQARIDAYSAAMGRLYAATRQDVDAGAFYALSLLAAEAPTTPASLRSARPWRCSLRCGQNIRTIPGSCTTSSTPATHPSLAPEGLAAARRYGEIASSGPHAVHMPGHIFARLGLWQEDIAANIASVAASQAAEARHESGWMDQFHSDDFLVYAYLQSGQEAELGHGRGCQGSDRALRVDAGDGAVSG